MPAIHSKTAWSHGKGDLVTFKRNPDHWYLRCLVPGTQRYVSERIKGCSSLEEAQQGAITCYARIIQPTVQVDGGSGSGVNFQVITSKNAKHQSRLISDCVNEFLEEQYGRFKCKEICEETYDNKVRYLTKCLLPYLSFIGVSHTREIKATTFKQYNIWRSRTTNSKVTRNIELGAFATFFTHHLVPERLIDPDLMVMKNFLPYSIEGNTKCTSKLVTMHKHTRVITYSIYCIPSSISIKVFWNIPSKSIFI